MHTIIRAGAVIVAAGSGTRFGGKKQFKLLGNTPLFLYSIQAFLKCNYIKEIVVVVHADDVNTASKHVEPYVGLIPIKITTGGERRQDSVNNGCQKLSEDINMVSIHDAARPFITEQMISLTIDYCENADGCILAIQTNDTVKVSSKGFVEKTIDRNSVWFAQTPQTFQRNILMKAIQQNTDATDESSMVESFGGKVKIIKGSSKNFKITTEEDWKIAERIVQ